ncbi:UNVERIFIED_CONTAM: hypothetical protein Sradi_6167500 [Sesamum radiatum]|uniref:Uncharacterized protein n=1 Tax=Sesamum radiatum TaxID=300843 RepID=A0AAW2K9E2_SESRA
MHIVTKDIAAHIWVRQHNVVTPNVAERREKDAVWRGGAKRRKAARRGEGAGAICREAEVIDSGKKKKKNLYK